MFCGSLLVISIIAKNIDASKSWQCGFDYQEPERYNQEHQSSYGYCFNDPSQYCSQHAVTMNRCKRFRNDGMYCCIMEHVDRKIYQNVSRHKWLDDATFYRMAGNSKRVQRAMVFILRDIGLANIKKKEELANLLSIILFDTYFLTNMEEHLPREIAINVTKYGHQNKIKYIGRGAIFVRGKEYYVWITTKLNQILKEEGKTDERFKDSSYEKNVNGLEAPEALMFSTHAFRAAYMIWRHSYSYVMKKPLGSLYNQLSDGTIGGLATTLYHLKGSIEDLPYLVNIWKRVSKILDSQVVEEEPRMVNHSSCKLEPFCRGQIVDKNASECNEKKKESLVQKILCKECTKDLQAILVFENGFLRNNNNNIILRNLIEGVRKNSKRSSLKMAFAIEVNRYSLSGEIKSVDDLKFYHSFQEGHNLHLLLHEGIKYINALRKPVATSSTNNKEKFIIVYISQNNSYFSQRVVQQIILAEEEEINFYSLYQNFYDIQSHLTLSLESRQLNLARNDLIERFCNDPTVLTVNSSDEIKLGYREKQEFVIRLHKGERFVYIQLHNLQGSMKHLEMSRKNWFLPFDHTYNTTLSIRDIYRFNDRSFVFSGGDVHIVYHYMPGNIIGIYEVNSYEIQFILEGKDSLNEMILSISLATPELWDKLRAMLNAEVNGKVFLKYFQISCIFSACLLVLLLTVFFAHSPLIVGRITCASNSWKNDKKSSHLSQINSNCRYCYRRLSDSEAYWKLYDRDNGKHLGVEVIPRRNSFLSAPTAAEKRGKCIKCRNKEYGLFISFIHFCRVVLLLIFEIITVTTIFQTQAKIYCKVFASIQLLIMQSLLFLSIGELLCYCGFFEHVKRWKIWLLQFVVSLAFTLLVAFVRNEDLLSCWPYDNTICGRLAIGELGFMTLVYFGITVYFCVQLWKSKSKDAKIYVGALFVFAVLLVTLCILLSFQEDKWVTIGFAAVNCLTIFYVTFYKMVVQSKVQNWFTLSRDKAISRSNSPAKRPLSTDPYARDLNHLQNYNHNHSETVPRARNNNVFLMTDIDNNIINQPIKQISLVPIKSKSNKEELAHSLPTYTMKSVFCSSESSLSSSDTTATSNTEYDDRFQIIVREKRPRSASEMVTSKTLKIEKPLIQHNSTEMHRSAKQIQNCNESSDLMSTARSKRRSVGVSMFKTNKPPVIEIHHDVD